MLEAVIAEREAPRKVGLEEFPPVTFNPIENNMVKNEVRYLSDFLDLLNVEEGEERLLYFPSVSELSMFFFCHEFEVMEAIHLLKKEGYLLEVTGIYEPVRVNQIPAKGSGQISLFQKLRQMVQHVLPYDERQFSHRGAAMASKSSYSLNQEAC
ncbi:MAG: hypothetical protein KTR14_01830 [Vampirovibrio sp.]|nr:hypothetical protein [Vampirovibrio sp.]